MRSEILGNFALCCSFIWLGQCYCFDFDQNYFGVLFSPHVKDFYVRSAETITRNNIKTMLNVTSRKFSKLLVGASEGFVKQDYYFHNLTHYHGSSASVYTGEAAAIMNKENGSQKISVMYQLEKFDTAQQVKWDISVALEAAGKANNIFPGTVEGISLHGVDNLKRILNHLHKYRGQVSALGIKLGLLQDCYQFKLQKKNETWYNITLQIVQAADFIICGSEPISSSLGPVNIWPSIATDFMSFKRIIGEITPSVEVIAYTMWPRSGFNKREQVENLELYWEMASKWAGAKRYRIYMGEAFDNPNRYMPRNKQLGWWKLKWASDIDSIDEYVEKVTEPAEATTTKPSNKNNNMLIRLKKMQCATAILELATCPKVGMSKVSSYRSRHDGNLINR